MKTYLSSLIFGIALFLFISGVQSATGLPEDYEFYDEIAYLIEEGVIPGTSALALQPDEPVTRAEVAVMIGYLKRLDRTKQETLFKDVPSEHLASGFINAVAEAGYLKGYKDGTYRPDQPINRGDAALILPRIFNLGLGFNNEFADVPPSSPLNEAIGKILAANITTGYPDGTFRPKEIVTRGEFAAFLARGLEPAFKNDAVIPQSYQKDKTKAYTYERLDGSLEVHKFIDVPDREGLAYGFMWIVQVDGDAYEYLELENYQFFAFGYPYSEYDIALSYPVLEGNTFNTGLGDEIIMNTITGTHQTVETKYKTFTDATEVTTQSGFKYYLAKGYATIKSIDETGQVVFELVNVE